MRHEDVQSSVSEPQRLRGARHCVQRIEFSLSTSTSASLSPITINRSLEGTTFGFTHTEMTNCDCLSFWSISVNVIGALPSYSRFVFGSTEGSEISPGPNFNRSDVIQFQGNATRDAPTASWPFELIGEGDTDNGRQMTVGIFAASKALLCEVMKQSSVG